LNRNLSSAIMRSRIQGKRCTRPPVNASDCTHTTVHVSPGAGQAHVQNMSDRACKQA
jgi:hypothetical protein